jgi:hypothetical protein
MDEQVTGLPGGVPSRGANESPIVLRRSRCYNLYLSPIDLLIRKCIGAASRPAPVARQLPRHMRQAKAGTGVFPFPAKQAERIFCNTSTTQGIALGPPTIYAVDLNSPASRPSSLPPTLPPNDTHSRHIETLLPTPSSPAGRQTA